MICITGDIHGDVFERINPTVLPGEDTWTENDTLIVLGDFGLIFYPRLPQYETNVLALERKKLEYLEEKPYTVCFIDGNHENFERLEAEFPEETRFGGPVKRLGRNVFWLRRGRVYTIEGRSFFCMGGAYSIDKGMRTEGFSWWPQELPSGEEYRTAAKSLSACGNRVDYVLTHTAPDSFIYRMGKAPDRHDAELTGFLEWVLREVSFRHWFFGHWHTDRAITEKATALFTDAVILEAPRDNGE